MHKQRRRVFKMASFFKSRVARILPLIALSLSLLFAGCNTSPKLNGDLKSTGSQYRRTGCGTGRWFFGNTDSNTDT